MEELCTKNLSKDLVQKYSLAKEEALNISREITENLNREKKKRSYVQYETTEEIKRSKAKTSLDRAKEFSQKIFNMIN